MKEEKKFNETKGDPKQNDGSYISKRNREKLYSVMVGI